MKKILFLIILVLVIYVLLNKDIEIIEADLPEPKDYKFFLVEEENLAQKDFSIPFKEQNEIITEIIKKEINLNIPFISQAPTANWEQPYQDACEEVSILMVDYYYTKKEPPSAEELEFFIQEMVKWQEENWGEHLNLPIIKLKEFVENYFNYKTEIIYDLNVEKIKNYLDRGIPVIVPANGKKLDNPYFSNGGPEYHMLVIKGYLGDNFITNDPGTKRGLNFIYTSENLLYSIADWDIKKSHVNMELKNGLIILLN